MQARDECVVGPYCLVELAEMAAGKQANGREVEPPNRCRRLSEADDRLTHRITDQPSGSGRGENSQKADPCHVLEPADFAFEFRERQIAADQPGLVAVSRDLAVHERVGRAIDIDDMTFRGAYEARRTWFRIRTPNRGQDRIADLSHLRKRAIPP